MGIWGSCALLPLRHEKTKDIQRGPSLLRETVKSIFWIDESVAGSNGPSGRRRECAVQAFSPQVKTLAQGRLCRPEHWNTEEWSRPLGSGCQNKRQLLLQLPFVLAQRVGFEPTCDCSQTDFESLEAGVFWGILSASLRLSERRKPLILLGFPAFSLSAQGFWDFSHQSRFSGKV